jgi:hypothetical protein
MISIYLNYFNCALTQPLVCIALALEWVQLWNLHH